MKELLPLPPRAISVLFEPSSRLLGLPLLSDHIHELLAFFFLYHLIYTFISPYVSTKLFPKIYPQLDLKKKIDWDVHVVSLVQSLIISVLAATVILFDLERKNMIWEERVWSHTGATNTLLGIGNGYLVWHLWSMIYHREQFGWSMVAHSICALAIMMSGFRPAFNFYAPVGAIYELSNIPLNLHRFILKLGMDGSRAQLINGVLLIITFFLTRIIYGSYTMFWLFYDMYHAVTETLQPLNFSSCGNFCESPATLPLGIIMMHFIAETTLHVLNFVWFNKMMKLLLRVMRGKQSKSEKVLLEKELKSQF